jgi:hypothetical protein
MMQGLCLQSRAQQTQEEILQYMQYFCPRPGPESDYFARHTSSKANLHAGSWPGPMQL